MPKHDHTKNDPIKALISGILIQSLKDVRSPNPTLADQAKTWLLSDIASHYMHELEILQSEDEIKKAIAGLQASNARNFKRACLSVSGH